MIRNVLESATVTLLGAIAGYWIEVFLPSRVHGEAAYRAAVLGSSVFWAIMAALIYFAVRLWEASRQAPTVRTIPNA